MERKPGENFNRYKARRKREQNRIKVYLKGRWFWKSKNLYHPFNPDLSKGTYIRGAA